MNVRYVIDDVGHIDGLSDIDLYIILELLDSNFEHRLLNLSEKILDVLLRNFIKEGIDVRSESNGQLICVIRDDAPAGIVGFSDCGSRRCACVLGCNSTVSRIRNRRSRNAEHHHEDEQHSQDRPKCLFHSVELPSQNFYNI